MHVGGAAVFAIQLSDPLQLAVVEHLAALGGGVHMVEAPLTDEGAAGGCIAQDRPDQAVEHGLGTVGEFLLHLPATSLESADQAVIPEFRQRAAMIAFAERDRPLEMPQQRACFKGEKNATPTSLSSTQALSPLDS